MGKQKQDDRVQPEELLPMVLVGVIICLMAIIVNVKVNEYRVNKALGVAEKADVLIIPGDGIEEAQSPKQDTSKE